MRGAAYCRSAMRAPPAPLADFRREPAKPFDYLTRREIDEIVVVVRDLAEKQGAMSEGDNSSSSSSGSARSSRSSHARPLPAAEEPMDS